MAAIYSGTCSKGDKLFYPRHSVTRVIPLMGYCSTKDLWESSKVLWNHGNKFYSVSVSFIKSILNYCKTFVTIW